MVCRPQSGTSSITALSWDRDVADKDSDNDNETFVEREQSPSLQYATASLKIIRMWANAQRDGRPAEYGWRPLFNAAKFG